jgi:hypothetical protein
LELIKNSSSEKLALRVRFDRGSPDGQSLGVRLRAGDSWFEATAELERRRFKVKCLWLGPKRLEGVEWNAHIRCRVH